MATVKELEAVVAKLTERITALEVALAAKPAAAKPATARPAARCGITTTYASAKEAMAAAKELAVAGKHRVCVTGCVVTSFPR